MGKRRDKIEEDLFESQLGLLYLTADKSAPSSRSVGNDINCSRPVIPSLLL